MNIKGIGLVTIAALLFGSCASAGKIKNRMVDCRKKMTEAVEFYNAKKYSKAKSEFEEMKLQCNGSEVMDTVLYYLGMTNIQLKKFIEARTEMELLVQDFPSSIFHDEARFRVPYCVFRESNSFDRDQKETKEAARLFRDLLDSDIEGPVMDSIVYYYKESIEKLAKKQFVSAQFYEKTEKYEAAVVYYGAFINEYPQSKFTDDAKLSMIEILLKLDRDAEAKEAVDMIVEQNANQELVSKAKELLKRKEKK